MAVAQTTKTIDWGTQTLSYRLKRSSRRRRTISMRVDKAGLIVLSPLRMALSDIERFIFRNTDWVSRQLERIGQENKSASDNVPTHVHYLGGIYPLQLIESEMLNSKCVFENEVLRIVIPPESSMARRKAAFSARLNTWYRAEAKRIFTERLGYFKELFGIEYRQLLVTSPRRQWGSCDARNTIRLNWRLVMAAPHLIDYVVVHELAHVTHKNHSQKFWGMLGSVMPDYAIRRRELREFGRSSAIKEA